MQSNQAAFSTGNRPINLADSFLDSGRVQLLVAVKAKIPFKSLVLCIRGASLSTFLGANPSWHSSKQLDAAFQYLRSDESGLVRLELAGLQDGDVFSVEPWLLEDGSSTGDLIEGIYQQGKIGGIRILERLV